MDNSLKESLARKFLEKRLQKVESNDDSFIDKSKRFLTDTDKLDEYCDFKKFTGYQQIQIIEHGGKQLNIPSPFFKMHDESGAGVTCIQGKEYINYANYNYLGLATDKGVCQAVKKAVDTYGTSVSASRIVSGERLIQRDLENEIAKIYNVDDSVVFVSGHATNVTTIGFLFGGKDLILHDALVHNSILQGIQLSGATRMPFKHNDVAHLEELLLKHRRSYERVLIVTEGMFSMDGDLADLPSLIQIKSKHKALLMVDEAHSFGVIGSKGFGVREYFNLDSSDVDIWMGTLSKTLASCGGYIAGNAALIKNLRYSAPGFLYSVGISPPAAAASLEALKKMQKEPDRVNSLQANGKLFYDLALGKGIDIGFSQGHAIIPALTHSSVNAAKLANYLFEKGVNVQPIFYPAVEEKKARLRFFINAYHTEEQIEYTVDQLVGAKL